VLALVVFVAAGCANFSNPKGWAGPVVTDNLLIASTDEGEISALNAEDFSTAWTFPTGREDPELDLEAIYTTPLVSGGTVYLGAYTGEAFALSLEDGSEKWRFDTEDNIIAGLGALYSDGSIQTLFVGTDEGTLYALDAETGRAGADFFDAGDSIWAAPLLSDGVLYVASVNGKLFALDADTFDPVWDAPFEAGQGLISDPVLAGRTILIGGIDRELHAVDTASGEERWSFPAGNWFWGQPLVANGTVYAPSLDGRLYALNLADGAERWSFKAEEGIRSKPVLVDGTLVIVDRKGTAYGLNPEDDPEGARLKWSKTADKTVLSNPLVMEAEAGEEGATVKVFISAEGGDLFRLEDPVTGVLSRLDPNTGRFLEVVIQ
jgi:outer membrane protein assembly factor BamB